MRLRKVKKTVQGPKLLDGRAKVPVCICLAPEYMLSLTDTQLDCSTFSAGNANELENSLFF